MSLRKLFSDSTASSFRMFLSSLRLIVLIPIFTKFAGEEVYGQWVSIEAIVFIFTTVGGLHLKGALIRYYGRENLVENVVFLALVSSGFTSAIFLLVGYHINILPSTSSHGLIFVVAGWIFLNIIVEVLINIPRAKSQVKIYELLVGIRLLLEIGAVSAIIFISSDIVMAVTGLLAVDLLFGIGIFLTYIGEFSTNILRHSKLVLEYSVPMVPKELGHKILSHSDRYLLAVLVSPAAAGIYAAAYSLSAILRNFTDIFNPTLYPMITNAWDSGRHNDIRNINKFIHKICALVGIPALVGLVVLGEPILKIISTASIAAAGKNLIPILGVGFLLRGFDNPLSYILNAKGKNEYLARIFIAAGVGNLLLNLILIPQFGILGAAISTLSSQSLITGMLFIENYNYVDVEEIRFGKIIFSSVFMGVLLFSISYIFGDYEMLVSFPVIGVIVYGLLMLLVGGVHKKEVEAAYITVRDRFT